MRTPFCRYGHPLIDVRDRSQLLTYRVDGHIFQTCRECAPCSYAFGVASRYHDLITFYAISHTQLLEVLAVPATVPTRDILTLIGYATHDDTP